MPSFKVNKLNEKKTDLSELQDDIGDVTIITPEKRKKRRTSVAPHIDYVAPEYLAGFVGRFYQHWELWQFFLLLVITSFFAAMLLRLSLKKLKKATE